MFANIYFFEDKYKTIVLFLHIGNKILKLQNTASNFLFMKRLKRLLGYINNNYFFDSTKRERRQVISLLIVSIILLIGNKIYSSVHNCVYIINSDILVNNLNTADDDKDADTLNRLDKFIVNRYKNLKLFNFDPNTADADELEQLGLTFKQSKKRRQIHLQKRFQKTIWYSISSISNTPSFHIPSRKGYRRNKIHSIK